LPSLNLPAGGPNNPEFQPCKSTKGHPWISVETENNPDKGNRKKNDVEQGQRSYYFPCEFPANNLDKLTAQMNGPDGVEPLPILSVIPNPDLQMQKEKRVVVWNAIQNVKSDADPYTLTISDGQGHDAHLSFSLHPTSRQRILAVPYQSGPAGTTFQINYCGYEPGEVIVDFYYGMKNADPQKGYDFFHSDTWNVAIDSTGCVVKSLISVPGDPARIYLINDREPALTGSDYIWLTP